MCLLSVLIILHFTPGPRLELPHFDGAQPCLWQSRCEEYFALCGMPIFLWFLYASAQFEGATAKWLKSFKHSSLKAGWEEFCITLLAHFGRNQHATLLQRMFHICQITIVDAYVEEFS
jgi:hypothetical protein